MRVGVITLLLVAASAVGCASRSVETAVKPALVERTLPSMGSEVHLSVWTTDRSGAGVAFEKISKEFARLEALMSTWKDGSPIQQVNAAGGQHPVRVEKELLDIFHVAAQVSDWTNGKFDVTFAAMSGLWKFDYQNDYQNIDNPIPDRNEIARRRKLINYHDLILDDQAGTAFLRRPGMSASLGGIGKGYALDRARMILDDAGFHDYMLQFGGDMYVAGRAGDRPWRLGIQDPRGPAGHYFASIDLSGSTFSTSGDYERFFIKDGRRYHHIIDPATGEPSVGCRSVTIIASSATIADGLSTGVFIMGPKEGMALIERLPDVEGVIVSSKNEVLVSSGLQGRLKVLAQPTDAP